MVDYPGKGHELDVSTYQYCNGVRGVQSGSEIDFQYKTYQWALTCGLRDFRQKRRANAKDGDWVGGDADSFFTSEEVLVPGVRRARGRGKLFHSRKDIANPNPDRGTSPKPVLPMQYLPWCFSGRRENHTPGSARGLVGNGESYLQTS